jgi:NAD(P)-dependent dehydrogenase (short-subunit alcohol dehydrogenase family)
MSYNPFSLENKTILITGASSGIGKETAIECSKLGANVIITGRNLDRLNETFSLLQGSNNVMFSIDLTNELELDDFLNKLPKLDGVVHSAGILDSIPFSFTSNVKLSNIMKVNFEIPFGITQYLIKNKKINKLGSIVFVSSLSGFSTIASGISAYSASKGAICASIRVMAFELASKKIRVNSVCPGMVKTEMNIENDNLSSEQLKEDELRNYPLGYGTPIEVAQPITFLLSQASSWITGTNMVLDGGASIH